MRHALWLSLVVLAAGCGGPPAAVDIDPARDICKFCEQPVTNQLFAAQVVEPGEDPAVFDDIGCMVDYLARKTRLKAGAIAYVADHFTGRWVPAVTALYTRNPQIDTPRRSHLVAHASMTSQNADPAARTGTRVTAKELLPIDMLEGAK